MLAIDRHRLIRALTGAAAALVLACSAPAATPATSVSAAPSAVPSQSPRYSAYSVVEATAQPPGSILITMSNFAFTPSTLALPAGKIVLYLVNPSTTEHSFTLREPSVSLVNVVAATPNIRPGKAAVLTIDSLRAGVYRATCAVPGHADQGMIADVTVK